MKSINLSVTLKAIMNDYHELNKQLDTSVRDANKQYKDGLRSGVYTDEHLRKALDTKLGEATAHFNEAAEQLNAKAKKHISAMKETVIPALSDFAKPADYYIRVNNALQFIQADGAEIDDETASQILHEFERDVETMQRFRRVIENQKGEKLSDAYGDTTFPKTFGRLERCEKLIAAFAELESTADRLFVRTKSETETEYTKTGVKLSVPMDCYTQLVSETNVVEQADTIESMIGTLFTSSETSVTVS